MPVSHDELVLLQAQLEGLESIFFELLPFGIELKRQQVQDYYNQRFDMSTVIQASVAKSELRRNFNTRANQVRNLVDSAESIGDVGNKFNLILAAACLPEERNYPLTPNVIKFCQGLILENKIDSKLLEALTMNTALVAAEARILLACAMFAGIEHVAKGPSALQAAELLSSILNLVKTKDLLPRNDPFYTEALYFLEGMSEIA